MRSRYSAYCTQAFDYILNTYSQQQRNKLSLIDISDSANDTQWLGLTIVQSGEAEQQGFVEFKAWYKVGKEFFLMHEHSQFAIEQGQWRYTTGEMLADSGAVKVGRNETCLCGSGKKFKRCCGK